MAYAGEEDTVRGRWVRLVYRTGLVGDSTRVLLLGLSEGMDAGGRVEVSRDEVAAMLARAPRRVSGRYTEAIDAGLLEQVRRGTRASRSVFQAAFPKGEEVTDGGHLFPWKQATDSRPLSEETSDTRGSHVSEETSAPRGSRSEPNRGHPGVTKSGAPIREGFHHPSHQSHNGTPQPDAEGSADGGLFDLDELDGGTPTPAALERAKNRRIKALTDLYFDAVDGMGDWHKVRSVVKKAVESSAAYTDEQIARGLRAVAEDGQYTLTSATLRVAITRTQQPPRLHAVPGGYQPTRTGHYGPDADPWAQAGDIHG